MLKLEYLLQAFKHHCYRKTNWITSLVSLVQESADDYKKDPYSYRLVQTPTGYMALVDDVLVPIKDSQPNTPLFTFNTPITVTPEWAVNISNTIQTTVGQAIVNSVTIADVFGKKIPYIAGTISVKKIEAIIAPKLKDTPAKDAPRLDTDIYVDEYTAYIDRLQFIGGLASLCVWSATKRNLIGPTGIDEYKAKLIKEYGDTLNDPATLAEFDTKLKAFDAAYLEGDPSAKVFLTGKARNMARKKMFLSYGADASFLGDKQTPTLTALKDEWPTETDKFISIMGGLRYGSYARGAETVKGGVTAKSLLRSLGTYTITMTDCNAFIGLTRTFTDMDYDRLVGRYIQTGSKWQLVPDIQTAKAYIDKPVTMRSPQYCRSKPETFCKYCVGEKLALNPNGLSLAATDLSSALLATFMALMHGKVLESVHFDYTKHLT